MGLLGGAIKTVFGDVVFSFIALFLTELLDVIFGLVMCAATID